MAKKMKRLLAMVLAIVTCLGVLNVTAFAETQSNNYPVSKTADGLDEADQTNVTLEVPGEQANLGVDIIYILGSFLSGDAVETNIMISCLKDTMSEIIATGTTVNFAIVPFSSDDKVVLDFTKIETEEDLAELNVKIAEAIAAIGPIYDGVNMENAFVKAKKLFSESPLAEYPERQHLVMISSGHTYYFDSGENNENIATVPVNFIASGKALDGVFCSEKAWMQARNANPNSYPIPKAIVNEYNANSDQYESLWDCYWTYIDRWAKADIAAGDVNLYEVTSVEKGDFLEWTDTWEVHSQTWKSYGAIDPNATAEEIASSVKLAVGTNPLTNDSAAHAILNERAMWEAYEYLSANITGTGINFHPVYNALRADGTTTNGNWCPDNYNIDWTNQYIGHSFMNFLAGGEAVVYSKTDNKAFFGPIKEKILYTCSVGSTVEDFIGYDEETGNFEFVQDAATMSMKLGNKNYTAAQIDTKEGATSSYAFTAEGKSEATFWLDYYYGDGKTTEKFIWTFGENVSLVNKAALTYKLQLTEKQEEEGVYIVPTNNSAVLYPVDSNGKPGTPQIFPVPTVEYEVKKTDVDIVIAIGPGIAGYSTSAGVLKGVNAAINLVEPLMNSGDYNVKLGIVGVETLEQEVLPLTLLDENYKQFIETEFLNMLNLSVGPTNLEGPIRTATRMLSEDTSVAAENKYMYVIATGRTYWYEDDQGNDTTIVTGHNYKGTDYICWSHRAWQRTRINHTSLYAVPGKYNDNWEAYWQDITNWVAADGDTYAYSVKFGDTGTSYKNWSNTNGDYNTTGKYAPAIVNNTGLEAGFALGTNNTIPSTYSKDGVQHALNYERAQYEAWQAFGDAQAAGYNVYSICSESVNYQNDSPYILNNAAWKNYGWNTGKQIGHSFMDFLAGGEGEANLVFDFKRNADGTPVLDANYSGYYVMNENFFPAIVDSNGELVRNLKSQPVYKAEEKLTILTQPEDAEGALGEMVSISVEAEGEGLKYQWYFRNAGAKEFSKSSIKKAVYEAEMTKSRSGREVYCVITDAEGNTVTTETAKLIRVVSEELAIVTQPKDVDGILGETVSISVEAKGEGLKYQWYFRNAGAEEFSKSSIKKAVYEAEMNKSRNGREVYCVITDALGNTVTTETATMRRVVNEELAIVTQPKDAEGILGETVSISVEAKGEDLKYQWYFRNAGAEEFSKSSIKKAVYEAEMNKSRNGREVYCVITDALGNTVTSETVKMIRVATEELAIIAQPEDAAGALGETVSVTVEAKGEGLKYQWYFRNAGAESFSKSSIKTATYETEMTKSRSNREIYCIITDALGNTVTTDTVKLIRNN